MEGGRILGNPALKFGDSPHLVPRTCARAKRCEAIRMYFRSLECIALAVTEAAALPWQKPFPEPARPIRAILDPQTLTLTRMEYRLLALLVEHAAEVVPRPILLMLTPTVDAHLWRLRKKLGTYAGQYIETVIGVGYRFRPTPGP